LSTKVSVRVADGTQIEPGGKHRARLPARLHVGETLIEIESSERAEPVESSLLRTIGAPVAPGSPISTLPLQLGSAPGPEELTRWFEALIGVQRAAASSPDFYDQTARAVVDLIGLDSGLVLLRRDDRWVSVASYPDLGERGHSYSASILRTMERERRTFY